MIIIVIVINSSLHIDIIDRYGMYGRIINVCKYIYIYIYRERERERVVVCDVKLVIFILLDIAI
jgi:hypothetical protein